MSSPHNEINGFCSSPFSCRYVSLPISRSHLPRSRPLPGWPRSAISLECTSEIGVQRVNHVSKQASERASKQPRDQPTVRPSVRRLDQSTKQGSPMTATTQRRQRQRFWRHRRLNGETARRDKRSRWGGTCANFRDVRRTPMLPLLPVPSPTINSCLNYL